MWYKHITKIVEPPNAPAADTAPMPPRQPMPPDEGAKALFSHAPHANAVEALMKGVVETHGHAMLDAAVAAGLVPQHRDAVMAQYASVERYVADYVNHVKRTDAREYQDMARAIAAHDTAAANQDALQRFVEAELPRRLLNYMDADRALRPGIVQEARDRLRAAELAMSERMLATLAVLSARLTVSLSKAAEKGNFIAVVTTAMPKWLALWAGEQAAQLARVESMQQQLDQDVAAAHALHAQTAGYRTLMTHDALRSAARTRALSEDVNALARCGEWYAAPRASPDAVTFRGDAPFEHIITGVEPRAGSAGRRMMIVARVTCAVQTAAGQTMSCAEAATIALYVDAVRVDAVRNTDQYVHLYRSVATANCRLSLVIAAAPGMDNVTSVTVDPRGTYMTVVVM